MSFVLSCHGGVFISIFVLLLILPSITRLCLVWVERFFFVRKIFFIKLTCPVESCLCLYTCLESRRAAISVVLTYVLKIKCHIAACECRTSLVMPSCWGLGSSMHFSTSGVCAYNMNALAASVVTLDCSVLN